MKTLNRHAAATVQELLASFPVVVIGGARQVGKTTLARQIVDELGGTYLTLDDVTVRSHALSDPQGFVSARAGLTVIDEVQLAPQLLLAIKFAVDHHRTPGRFLITGSANLLRLKSVGESLAGRSAWIELGPMSWAEIESRPISKHLEGAFAAESASNFADALPKTISETLIASARKRATLGGMPATLKLSPRARRAWYQGYRQTFLERDLRQLAQIENLPEFTRLLSMAALRTASLLNRSALASDSGLSVATLRRYLALLEIAYQFFELPPFYENHGKRLVKGPKLYATDVGLVAHLDAIETFEEALSENRAGALVETWAMNELLSLDRLGRRPSTASFFRTSTGREVDLVLERGRHIVAIEIKAASTISSNDTLGLRELRDAVKKRFRLGIVAHLGTTTVALDPSIVAVPLPVLLGVA